MSSPRFFQALVPHNNFWSSGFSSQLSSKFGELRIVGDVVILHSAKINPPTPFIKGATSPKFNLVKTIHPQLVDPPDKGEAGGSHAGDPRLRGNEVKNA